MWDENLTSSITQEESGLWDKDYLAKETQNIMSQYENEFSNFPNKKITRHNFKNIDDNIASIINQINALRSQGLYNQASRIIENNKDILAQYVVDAVTFRTWEEEIYNTQRYAKKVQQQIYFDDEEPDYCEEDDIWIGV